MPKKRERQKDTWQDRGRKMARMGERRDDRCSKPPTGRFTSFTSLTAPIDQVLMQTKDEGALTFPDKLKGDPNKWSRDKYYRFHRNHGHDTADYYNLKQQLEAFIRQGKLQKFVRRERADLPHDDYRFVQKGSKDLSQNGSERPITGIVPKMTRIDNPIIGFLKEDARCLHHPHDDALVVSIQIGDYNTHRVLVDNRSSADILYYPMFQQMRINKEHLVPTNAPLVGFGGTKVYPIGTVTLPITIRDYPQQIIKDVTFLVVDCSSAYNAIIG